MKLHLVDGTYELFRAHFGAPPSVDSAGRSVGATRGLLRTLLGLLRDEAATHVAIAFDEKIESFRNHLFAGYKTGEGIEPELLSQFPLAERAAHALGFVVWPMVEFEADDALATAAARWTQDPSVEQIVLCSPDKDLAQCVAGDRIVMLDRRKRAVMNEEGVATKFGVPPRSIPDWLALVGDAADGIPGVARWGPKSAAALLAKFGTIDRIPIDPAAWEVTVRGRESLAESLNAHRGEADLYRTLATLRRDVPLRENLGELEWRGARRPELIELCGELDEKELLSRVPRWRD
ncbi:MAG: flap endonuclease [Candidatus Eisenbacteria bacterium]|nr:flap endonuclease [Candidatus Eisenbacteria bacterium]MCC7141528.1 flap endonuclease [Candidatus Eisenbacteria bacterium]